jgi:alpha-galactosidase
MKTNASSHRLDRIRLCLRNILMTVLLIFISVSILFLYNCKANHIASSEADTLVFHSWAPTPPMGWNSWDCYGPTVVEDEVKANADYMAANLKKFGWQYIVIDIRWYVENDKSGGYNEVDPVFVLDYYGRYQPAVNRFPSAANGKGFKPMADYVHSKGLKFGIHIMRGISVEAVKKNTPILGTNLRAQDIYSPLGQCVWLRDNYTVDSKKDGAQEYYNSLFQLYASWGIDFVKVDDLSGRFPEIEMIRKAIDNSERPIVLSISPGGSQPEDAEFLRDHANMWRTTDDFWDNWPQLKPEFATCERWAQYAGPGYYPDADMLPLGKIGLRAERGKPRMSGFTKDEQYALMSLFSIFRSPLMFGGDLPGNDEFTLSLLTNKEVLYVNQYSRNNKQLFRKNDLVAWTADDPKNGDKFLALFNIQDQNPVEPGKAIWKSDLITNETPGQSVDLDVDITGAKKLYLVATYDDNGRFESHDADWIEPKLVIGRQTKNLTDLNWVKASAGRGMPTINMTARGGKLTVGGIEYKNGISVNAISIIEYDLPDGVTRFTAKAGLDNSNARGFGGPPPAIPGQPGIPDMSAGSPARVARPNKVKFMVFIEDPTGTEPPDAAEVSVKLEQLGLTGYHTVTDLWTGEKLGRLTDVFSRNINRHGGGLYRIH